MYTDPRSIINTYFVKNKKIFIINPIAFKFELNFEKIIQTNSKENIALKTFKGGIISLQLRSNELSKLPQDILKGKLEFYINYVSEEKLKIVYDMMVVKVYTIDLKAINKDEIYLIELKILGSIYRKENIENAFIPIIKNNNTYLFENKANNQKVNLLLKGIDKTIELPFLTKISYSNIKTLNTADIKTNENLNTNTKTTNRMLLNLSTKIYEELVLTNSNQIKTINNKQKILKTLRSFIENENGLGGKIKLIFLERTNFLIKNLNLNDLDFILNDINIIQENSCIRIDITLLEDKIEKKYLNQASNVTPFLKNITLL
ncbi:hypothetical protein B1U23_05605 (plasmid) [Borreliella burgdorferi]|uniref:Uncharacterized protein BBD11 n=1 Tax=Borreliella burgdorferi (strain ATCC 35210 / DSM 4680 / CIP 102532 / B31) TaxID=224326 RepID=Y2811_BORBU|nr:hypothetical protein [Borreliella burgdorferi]P70838.2 RecName: Full=Uncharacterized protein BBD11 [Borreliella burgdorferi B31]ARS30841.1 hypothetical protein B1U23_05605 [Borreliella burgdorferi]ARS32565.1 hypothetical protein B1U21_01505 [Borreliella burgdorferi]MCD2399500.1 hypothetical protein [Borreliella burgdorferi]MCD2400561.1 hypothetical protein [Borreliella burgdorferi]MCD2402830.1 hypothetical protein [Borreliella burgdorferi]